MSASKWRWTTDMLNPWKPCSPTNHFVFREIKTEIVSIIWENIFRRIWWKTWNYWKNKIENVWKRTLHKYENFTLLLFYQEFVSPLIDCCFQEYCLPALQELMLKLALRLSLWQGGWDVCQVHFYEELCLRLSCSQINFFSYGIHGKGSRGLEGPCFSLNKVILFWG